MTENRIESPRLIMGKGALERIPLLCEDMGVKRPFIVTGPRTINLAAQKIKSLLSLDERSMTVIGHGQVNAMLIQRLLKTVESNDMIIAVGGGRIIDAGKVLGANKHFMAVPTALSNDGLVSPFCSIRTNDHVYSMRGKVPDLLVIDADVVLSAPERLWAAGFADLLSKKSSHYDWRLAAERGLEKFDPYAADFVEAVGDSCLTGHHPFFTHGIGRMTFMVSNILISGLATLMHGSTRPVSGSEHKIAHRLYQLNPDGVLHGELVALGTICSLYLQEQDWEAAAGVLKRAGAPITAAELGISDDLMIEALSTATKIRPERHTVLEERKVGRRDAVQILKRVGILRRNS